LSVVEIGCESGILRGRALVALAGEVLRLRKVVEAAGLDSTPPGEREELAEATT
jgi:hypothetical protein